MPKGEAKSKWNYNIDPKTKKEIGCKYHNHTWCNIPKYKRCKWCIRCVDGTKACELSAL